MRRALTAIALGLGVLLAPACDSVPPVAPEGSVLTISINPTFIEPDGQATVTVVAREPEGQPLNPGTEVFFSTTLGSIDQQATTDQSGVATAVLRGDGRAGTATVTATSGAAAAAVSEPIQIGSFAALISLQVTPTIVDENGGELELLSLVRDDRGALLENAVVNFQTEFGVLASAGAGVVTNASGEARDTLTVSPGDAAVAGDSFVVLAQTASGEGAQIEASFTVRVARLEPVAAFQASSAGGNSVFFNNQSTGAEPLSFAWDFNNDGTIESTQRSPTFDFDNFGGPGIYTVVLTVSNDFGTDTAVATLSVPL